MKMMIANRFLRDLLVKVYPQNTFELWMKAVMYVNVNRCLPLWNVSESPFSSNC